jgi:integrase/recombinase XerD
MLTIYRRHRSDCPRRDKFETRIHLEEDMFLRKGKDRGSCSCALWVHGLLGGEKLRKQLGTRDWKKAQEKIRSWRAQEKDPKSTVEPERKTIADAWKDFLADVEARKLHDSTVRKYKLLQRQMEEFAKGCGFRFLAEFDLPSVTQFRSSWKDRQRSSAKKLERLRAFFRFAQKRKWTPENPASELKSPKVTLCPTLPYTREEMVRILAAVDDYTKEMPRHGIENARRIRGLVLLLRYSGMRIGDAVNFSEDKLQANRLFLYTQKTGVPVNTILPDFVLRELEATPKVTGGFFFWSGKGKLDSAVRSWQTRLRKLFKLAKVPDGHPHRFRDTFAVELLLAGVPIERLSVLLGHQSVRITERHYSPWVRARQEQLESDLTNAWSQDPIALLEAKCTKNVQMKEGRIN